MMVAPAAVFALLPVGVVVADSAAGSRAQEAVVTGEVAGHAADDRALDATPGFGGPNAGAGGEGEGEKGDDRFHERYPSVAVGR
jgi:hypothetical protein